MNQADNNPETLNSAFKVKKGYHTTSRTRQNMWINGEKVLLDPKDPGGEHE
jgi:hypothetical protein